MGWLLGCFLHLLLFEFLLLLFGLCKQSFFDVAKVGVLQAGELFELRGPGWGDVTNLPGS